MQTDPISAAHAYRQALQRVLKASILHEARQAAARALDITFTGPEEGHLSISSTFGHDTQLPYVTIAIANPTESANPFVQLSVDVARQQAMWILEAADAAESDGFLINWLSGRAQMGEAQIGALLADFRAYRESRRKEHDDEQS